MTSPLLVYCYLDAKKLTFTCLIDNYYILPRDIDEQITCLLNFGSSHGTQQGDRVALNTFTSICRYHLLDFTLDDMSPKILHNIIVTTNNFMMKWPT